MRTPHDLLKLREKERASMQRKLLSDEYSKEVKQVEQAFIEGKTISIFNEYKQRDFLRMYLEVGTLNLIEQFRDPYEEQNMPCRIFSVVVDR